MWQNFKGTEFIISFKGGEHLIVYIDILIIENFIINLFLLLVTMKLLRYEYNRKIYIAALIGALYTLVIFSEISFLYSIDSKSTYGIYNGNNMSK